MRKHLAFSLIGLVLGVIFLPGGVASALTCSNISNYSQSTFSPCQQVGTWDDESSNRYTNNHSTDDTTLAFIQTNYLSNVYQDNGPPVEPYVQYTSAFVAHGTTSLTFTVRAKRVDQCDQLGNGWRTKVSLGGSPVCDNTIVDFTFSTDCCP